MNPILRLRAAVLWLAILTMVFLSISSGQIDTVKFNSDQLFEMARTKAFAGDREEARRLCGIIIARNAHYVDASILLARTRAWDGQLAEARSVLIAVLQEYPRYKDAIEALADVELWDKDYVRALEIANQGLILHPRDEDLLLKKARAFNGLGRDEETLIVLLGLEERNPSRSEIASMIGSIKARSVLNGVGVSYAGDRFSDVYDPMSYAALQVSRRTPYGSVFARMNYSDRFNSQGVQIETDLYPRLREGVYAYLNYGFSQSSLFPKHRFGAELYSKLAPSLEGSLGMRHLFFSTESKVTMYTGTVGYYFGNYWASFRPYFIPSSAGVSSSASMTMRRYFGDAETYVSLHAGIGFSADERPIQSSTGFAGQEVFFLKSQMVGLGWQQSTGSTSLFLATFDVTNQELSFNLGNYVVMYAFSVGFQTRF
jgi:YaiO family outer membrane protein